MREDDPATGRYLQADPLGLVDGASVYGYALGNPLKYVDQIGLIAGEIGGAISAAMSFARNYADMREANWKRSDKYFHCKANCEATRCGVFSGYVMSIYISWGREASDLLRGKGSWTDSMDDEEANSWGRHMGQLFPGMSCQQVCGRYRPEGLPNTY